MRYISILILFCFSINVYGASYSIAANTSIEVGNTFKLSISSGDVTGRLNVSSSNGGVVSIISDSKAWVEKNTVTVSLKANSVGTAVITVTPATLADDKGEVHLGSKSITITVKEKSVTPPPPPPPVNNGNDGNSNTSAKSSNNYLKNLKVNVEGLSP
ncbi:hypothetical protein, partial [Chryseobacterium sp.]|uniref:hypothetical protein n=1 Tax=Chryseobacterium sp. TaxID=1871047 RepID=UPI002FCC87E4